ncbi:MAG: hypothetical protein WA964_20945 [Ilumatobacter sp.]|uniref:hypothetical protein n=1 Tax=Ilumatobacter sp. TaxID=1967498 RepID=UPI003C76F4C1
MRRSLGGLILLASGVFFALAISVFWLDRVAFTPEVDTDATFSIMGDEDIRLQLASVVAGATASELGLSSNDLRDFVVSITQIRDGATEMRQFTADAHARLIGDRKDPVDITPEEQVQITRTERAAVLPAIRLPVEEVTAMKVIASVTTWTWLISFGLAVLTLLLGIILRPDRGEFAFAFGVGCASTGALVFVIGYLVPGFVFPSVSDDTWMGLFPQLAKHRLSATLIGSVAFIAVGAAAVFLTGGRRQRRQRSTPLASSRYRDQRNWS